MLGQKKIKECFKSDKHDQLGTEARKNSKNYSWIKRLTKIKQFQEFELGISKTLDKDYFQNKIYKNNKLFK